VSGLADYTDLNDATGLEALSADEMSFSQKGNPDKDLDSSGAKSNDSPQAQLDRQSQ